MSSLSALYAQLRLKQEQLLRMKQCKTSLTACRQDFFSYEYICLKPEVTSVTWQGNLAEKFDDLRENGMSQAYLQIENEQFEHIFEAVDNKIDQLIAEIATLEAAIAAAERDDD